jgi:hypothetical protein
MSHPHHGLPATPKEVGAVLDLMRKLAGELLKVETESAYLTSGAVLLGLIDGAEWDGADSDEIVPIPPAELDRYNVGYQVGQSLLRGASRHL